MIMGEFLSLNVSLALTLESANRFLTQTRPDVSSPEIYQAPSPSQAARFFATQGVANARMQSQPSQRHPLQTISFSDDIELDAPHHASLRRLTKRVATSPLAANDNCRSSPLLSPSPKNAFEVLSRNAKARSGKPKRRLERSEFVEAEAQESDDDEMFGFGFKKDEEEEEDGEDLDKTLDGLVDDREMDEKTAAASMVLEKFKSVDPFPFLSSIDHPISGNKRQRPTVLMRSCIWMRWRVNFGLGRGITVLGWMTAMRRTVMERNYEECGGG